MTSILEARNSQIEAYKAIQGLNLTKLFLHQERVTNILGNVDISMISKFSKSWIESDYYTSFKGMSKVLSGFDTNQFESIMSRLDWTTIKDALDIVEETTKLYIEENELNEEESVEIREAIVKQKGELFTEKQKVFWEIYLWPVILSLFFYWLGAVTQNQPTTVNNITRVNNYYKIEVGIDVNTLNDFSYRMISKDNVMPRKKPDCSSGVVGHLPIGKVVCVVDKYKKWVKVTWQNEKKEYCFGWVHNYKVTKFK